MAYDIKLESGVRLHTFAKDPEFKQRLVDAIAMVLYEARKEASEEVKKYMYDSAHEAFRAVHRSVYKKIIGGNMNILTQRRALRRGSVRPSWRGRMKRTTDMLSYVGIDRGMILRWINDGTAERWTTHMDGHEMKRKSVSERPKSRHYKYPSRLGGRGGAATVRTTTRGMFDKVANPNMSRAAEQLQELIDKIIIDMF